MSGSAADTTLDVTTSGAALTGVQPGEELLRELEKAQKDAASWRERFTGLQGTYQRDQQKWKTDAEKLAEVSNTLASLSTDRDGLKTKHEELSGQVDTLRIGKETAESRLSRIQTIISKFPALIEFEGLGLLPDGSGEEFEKKLAIFQDRLAKVGVEKLKVVNSGGSPSSPSGGEDGKKADDLWKEAMQALKDGKSQDYDRLMDAYYAKTKQE